MERMGCELPTSLAVNAGSPLTKMYTLDADGVSFRGHFLTLHLTTNGSWEIHR
jgi:hypothetical protein